MLFSNINVIEYFLLEYHFVFIYFLFKKKESYERNCPRKKNRGLNKMNELSSA